MGRRINYPCKVCKGNINLKTIPDDEVMWDIDYDEIAHTKCMPEKYDNEQWITTKQMRDIADI